MTASVLPTGGEGGRRARWTRWLQRSRVLNMLTVILLVAAIVAGIATYGALSAAPPLGENPDLILRLLNINLVILLALSALVARRLVILWVRRRRGAAGSRLQVRLAGLFAFVAITPTIIVIVFSALFFQFGIQSWFSDRVGIAVRESLSVAQAYLIEHQQAIRADALFMANDIDRQAERLSSNPWSLEQLISAQAALRGLTEAMVINGDGDVVVTSRLTLALQFETLDPEWIDGAREGEVVLLPTEADDRVRALVALNNLPDRLLVVGRLVESQVIGHMEQAEAAVAEYSELEGLAANLQIAFLLIFVVVGLLLLMVAVWIGLAFADALVTPLTSLIEAAERMRKGDLSARIDKPERGDEVGDLAIGFNRMAAQLEAQRDELVAANRLLDTRRRFTESVLAGVSASVLGLDPEGRIDLPNRAAQEFLDRTEDGLKGRRLTDVVPEMAPLLERALRRPHRPAAGQITLEGDDDNPPRTIIVRIVGEIGAHGTEGFVVTFDDISTLIAAQRKAAWADVARRIAHEIKNPLTPIQLAAERLKRRYLKQIATDPETFTECTDTIIRQVGDIGAMVDEFSNFARMPTPELAVADIRPIIREAVHLQSTAYAGVAFTCRLPDGPMPALCDGRQVSQAITNLLTNARQALIEDAVDPAAVVVTGALSDREVLVRVEDNGPGLPAKLLERLTEPYVTTRERGTGLGLAIVSKIMEDHGGRLRLSNRDEGGARAELLLPVVDPRDQRAAQDASAGRDDGRSCLTTHLA